jgi:predicted permease
VALVVGVITGLAPALKAPAADLMLLVRQGATGAGKAHRRRAGHVLIAIQVALALVLLTGAALMVNSLIRIVNVDMGFDPEGVLAAELRPQGRRYQDIAGTVVRYLPAVADFYERLESELRSQPGVESVGLISVLPTRIPVAVVPLEVVGGSAAAPDRPPRVRYQEVSDDLFEVLRMPIIRGRSFTPRDTESSPWVAVVNQTLARQVFGEANPIGQSIQADLSNGVEHPDFRHERPREIVGVVGDMRRSLRAGAAATIYVPYRQHLYVFPAANTWAVHIVKSVVVRSSLEPGRLEAALQASVAAVDATQLAYDVQPLGEMLSASAGTERRWMRLLGLCAAIALFLAALGIYGVVSQAVAGRTREIGIRLALGAQSGRLLRMVVRQGMVPVLVGVGLGTAASWGLTRFLVNFLFDVTPTDAATFAIASAVLVAVAMLACYLPARHTARVEPVSVLRPD